jgi:hypothetical protein
MKFLFFVAIVSFTSSSFAQITVSEVDQYYNEGVSLFKDANYKAANIAFRSALATNEVLPTNLSYYFAETLFHIRQFQNSKNFVDRYIKIAGQGGDFYEEALFLQTQIEAEFLAIKECYRCNDFGYRLIPCIRCNATGIETLECPQCRGTGYTICSLCTGRGVIITVDSFGQNKYETCPKCGGEGVTICDLCHGDKVITRTCTLCLGTKQRPTSIICNHQDEQPGLFR